VAITILSIAGSALLWGVSSAMQVTEENVDQTLALGMAQQLMDEILGARDHAIGGNPYEHPGSASSWEHSGQGRERYNDIDDFNGLRFGPPVELHGTAIGMGDGAGNLRHPNFRVQSAPFTHWRQEIDIDYVDPDNLSSSLSGTAVSDYRAIVVRIVYAEPGQPRRVLAQLRQVVTYVPPL